MGAEENLKTVQMIYEAFSRGDIAAVLEPLADDVDFAVEPNGPAPWHGLRRGKDEVAQFFQTLNENVEVTEFTPLAFATNDNDVMVVIRYTHRARATGRSGTMDLHHWWRFREGEVRFVRGTEDTLLTSQLLAAA